ncbi:MAG: hypothetical protein FWB80_12190 [Defluviitaleaceae bacterium]|nr:hypothetical protein [Defluviitaleaceae bacterium]
MANSNEKMRVLDLLESGKINTTEATQLLEVLNTPRFMTKETRDNAEEKLRHFAKECNKFAKEVGCKAKEMYKEAEPKIKKASQTALEKAANALDNLACSINESLEKQDEAATSDEPKEN